MHLLHCHLAGQTLLHIRFILLQCQTGAGCDIDSPIRYSC